MGDLHIAPVLAVLIGLCSILLGVGMRAAFEHATDAWRYERRRRVILKNDWYDAEVNPSGGRSVHAP